MIGTQAKDKKECPKNRTKNLKTNYFNFAVAISSVILILSLTFSVINKDNRKILLLSSSLAMPEGVASYVKKDILTPQYKSANAISQSKDNFSQGVLETPKAENTTAKIKDNTDLKSTPQDILSLMKKYKEGHKNDTSGGEIIEQTFTKKGATHSYKNVFVKNDTETKKLDIEKVLNEKVDMKIEDKSKPSVLIFHTHTTESYEILDRGFYTKGTNGRSSLPDRNVVRVGDEIEKELKKAGFNVIHVTKIHDKKYTGAYDQSRITVSEYLKKYPSIQVVLDVHRDAIHPSDKAKIKPVTEIDGKKAAQVMIITGAQEGRVTNFPDWEYNLRFALNLQRTICDMYPTLMRPVLFSQRKYVMDLSHCNVLIEMGSDVNTLEEAAYSGRLIGRALSKMMEEYVV